MILGMCESRLGGGTKVTVTEIISPINACTQYLLSRAKRAAEVSHIAHIDWQAITIFTELELARTHF